MSINNRQYLNDNIKEILDYDGPILVDIKVVPDENCYPMVAPGKSNAQMIGV
jgi:acetolactate synthase-1/2/3 large subunit